MIEDGRVELVGTVKHSRFLRDAGLEDLWDLYQSQDTVGGEHRIW